MNPVDVEKKQVSYAMKSQEIQWMLNKKRVGSGSTGISKRDTKLWSVWYPCKASYPSGGRTANIEAWSLAWLVAWPSETWLIGAGIQGKRRNLKTGKIALRFSCKYVCFSEGRASATFLVHTVHTDQLQCQVWQILLDCLWIHMIDNRAEADGILFI